MLITYGKGGFELKKMTIPIFVLILSLISTSCNEKTLTYKKSIAEDSNVTAPGELPIVNKKIKIPKIQIKIRPLF